MDNDQGKKLKPGPKPMAAIDKKINKTMTISKRIWDAAEIRAEELGFQYRGRVSVAAYIESLIKADMENDNSRKV